ncbi:hypothetical protein VSS74_25160 [Conexibacter stalactiti]|uniref:Uncharacterized protein n=1 Tax=Conexibacter stalactiti TaxID=1940611 RepID=A0ABU4HYV8_9ACTN|nr:hypothetical protein [Conexibacter stalactiti]MDW5597665.1 hypothetical protein [Conexibacter stalactiti]MEC5038307.1 hypothetical protein [Conexibacter stalactiti]
MATTNQALTGEWQFVATLTVDGTPIPNNWDAIDGGDTSSPTRQYRPGGRITPEVIPAVKVTGDVILERAYRGGVDGEHRKTLASKIGKEAVVTVFALDEARNEIPQTRETISGILKEVTRPAFRSEAEGVALYRVVVTPKGHWG